MINKFIYGIKFIIKNLADFIFNLYIIILVVMLYMAKDFRDVIAIFEVLKYLTILFVIQTIIYKICKIVENKFIFYIFFFNIYFFQFLIFIKIIICTLNNKQLDIYLVLINIYILFLSNCFVCLHCLLIKE